MGLVEKLGRKLAGSRSNELPTASKTDGSVAANTAMDRRAPQYQNHHGKCYTRYGYVHVEAAKDHRGIVQSSIVGPKDGHSVAPHNTRADQNSEESRKHHPPTIQPRNNNIVPPTSRLVNSPPDSRRIVPGRTIPPPDGPLRSEAHQITDGSRGVPSSLHRQPSIASSLHSSRSGKQIPFNNVQNRQGAFGGQNDRANAMPAKSRRPVEISTRRMEDSAYYAGFRDAVAQLERERQRRGPAISH